jgi:flagellar biosynthesis/type III secretory pathway chaperone
MYSERMIYEKVRRANLFMKEVGMEQHESESTASCNDSPPGQQENTLAAALSKAEELLQVLKQEEAMLRSFNNLELMAVLPVKELLVRELLAKVSVLHSEKESNREVGESPEYLRMKGFLMEIDKLNRSNQVFIESSLAHFDDFLDCIYPSNYGPGQEGPSRQKSATLKGLSFRKEI